MRKNIQQVEEEKNNVVFVWLVLNENCQKLKRMKILKAIKNRKFEEKMKAFSIVRYIIILIHEEYFYLKLFNYKNVSR